jgi:hypothetical protein
MTMSSGGISGKDQDVRKGVWLLDDGWGIAVNVWKGRPTSEVSGGDACWVSYQMASGDLVRDWLGATALGYISAK